MGTQQLSHRPHIKWSKRPNRKRLLFLIIVLGAIIITAVWILSSLSIIPSTWAVILSAIVTVLGVVVGLWPLVFPPKKSVSPRTSRNIQKITATRHSEIDEPQQNIEGSDRANRQTISSDDNSKISRPKQNIKIT